MPYFEAKVKVYVCYDDPIESVRLNIEECLDTASSSATVLELKALPDEDEY